MFDVAHPLAISSYGTVGRDWMRMTLLFRRLAEEVVYFIELGHLVGRQSYRLVMPLLNSTTAFASPGITQMRKEPQSSMVYIGAHRAYAATTRIVSHFITLSMLSTFVKQQNLH